MWARLASVIFVSARAMPMVRKNDAIWSFCLANTCLRRIQHADPIEISGRRPNNGPGLAYGEPQMFDYAGGYPRLIEANGAYAYFDDGGISRRSLC